MYIHFLKELNKFKKQRKEIMRSIKIKTDQIVPDDDNEIIYFTNPFKSDISGVKGICIKNGVNIFINDICIKNLKNIGNNDNIDSINKFIYIVLYFFVNFFNIICSFFFFIFISY